jgi:hypothetical protein
MMLQPRGREANEFESSTEMGSRADVGGGSLMGALDTLVVAGLANSAVVYLLLTQVDSACCLGD